MDITSATISLPVALGMMIALVSVIYGLTRRDIQLLRNDVQQCAKLGDLTYTQERVEKLGADMLDLERRTREELIGSVRRVEAKIDGIEERSSKSRHDLRNALQTVLVKQAEIIERLRKT